MYKILIIIVSVVFVLILLLLLLSYPWRLVYKGSERAKIDIKTLYILTKKFKSDTKRLPTLEEGLEVLVENNLVNTIKGYRKGGYLKKIPVDPWNYKYHYYSYSHQNDEKIIEIWSYGKDGKPGGKGENSDIRNFK